jgi:dTDP-4-dehydrorhamnose 3,5-epimerase-like enzyme
MMPTVEQLTVVDVPKFRDDRGLLVPIEFPDFVPFEVKRIFWIIDVPPGGSRGAHAHKTCHQFLICIAGHLVVEAFDGRSERSLELTVGNALYIKPGIFSVERFIERGTILAVLCDRPYDPMDYLNDR